MLLNWIVVREARWRPPPLLWIPLSAFLGLLFVADVYQNHYARAPVLLVEQSTTATSQNANLKGFLVKTEGCRIPAMDAFEKSIMQFVKPIKYTTCNAGLPALVDANMTSVFIVNASLAAYNISDEGLSCCYRPFWRKQPKENESDRMVKYKSFCILFEGSAEIVEEYVRVECYSNDSLIYTDFFAFVPLKNVSKVDDPRPLNVLVIGIDSVSRLNLQRQLPHTRKYLQKLGLVELLGYNKVGDNTFPNLVPVLTGYSEEELVKVCWPKKTDKFDKCPFIWKHYKEKGYKTAYAEDAAWMGTFNYVKQGFQHQPTDYYWSFFNRVSEEIIGNEQGVNAKRCVGARRVYSTLLDYIKKFTTVMMKNKQPYFVFFWEASISHDYMNALRAADEEYESLFKYLNDSGHLNETALVFMSDHGMRWGPFRSTFQGRMEERLPFLTVLLPRWYQKTYHTAFVNLQKNTRSLTTPYDLHETLKDLLNPFELTTENLNSRVNISRGYSLFATIPDNRTCENAEIAAHWCTCQISLPIEKNDPVVKEAAEFTVDYINTLLEGYENCSNLTLNDVFNARVLTHNGMVVDQYIDYEDYMITLETQPGGGVFEVTVRKHLTNTDEIFEITGTISRINLYGEQSMCVSDHHMKLYCYCK